MIHPVTQLTLDPAKKFYKQEGKVGTYQIILPFLTTARPMLKYLSNMWGAEGFGFAKNNYFEAYYYEDNLRLVAEEVLKISESNIPDSWQMEIREITRKLIISSRKLSEKDLTEVPVGKLKDLYTELFALDQAMWAILIFIDAFDIGVDREKIETIQQNYSFSAEELHTLLSPSVPSFISEWDSALLKYKGNDISISDLRQEFFWYAMDYSHFRELTADFIREESEKEAGHTFASQKTAQKDILKKYSLSSNPLQFFQELAVWRDERKKYNYIGLYGLMKILREVCRRQKIDPEMLNGLLPQQVGDLFEAKISEQKLAEQIKEGVFLHITADGEFRYSFGEEARGHWREVCSVTEGKQEEIRECKGMIASKGHAVGNVFVVNDPSVERYEHMQIGDILVTSMTRPEFLPFMKKAGAIVTNEGGISCHAAIVSREMKKPCIIGTKIATKVLKDGDEVEVNAETGIVKIIKKAGL